MQVKNYKYWTLVLLLGFVGTAYAVGEGFYLGGQVGQSNLRNDARNITTGGTPAVVRTSPSNTGIGGRLFLGYAVNQYLAVEGGWTYFSPSKYNTGVSPACGNPQIQERALDIVGKGTWPISTTGFGVFGKVGGAYARMSSSSRLASQTLNPCGSSSSNSSVRPVAGVGVSYDVNQNWVTDLSWTRIFKGGDFPNADLIALGLSYHFVDKYCGQFLC